MSSTVISVVADSTSFDFFSGLFIQAELPYSFDSQEEHPDLNWIPITLIDKWILDSDQDSSELVKWIRVFFIELAENDSWRILFAGHSFVWQSHNYFLVNTWDQTSATNGGYFDHYLLKYNAQHQLENIYAIGQTGINTSIYVDYSNDTAIWQRKTDYLELSYTISTKGTIYCQKEERMEYEGDELQGFLDSTYSNQIYDTIGQALVLPGNVTTYSIDLELP